MIKLLSEFWALVCRFCGGTEDRPRFLHKRMFLSKELFRTFVTQKSRSRQWFEFRSGEMIVGELGLVSFCVLYTFCVICG